MKYNNLTQDEKYIIEQKGTEYPFSGIYNDFYEEGVYLCKKCNEPLYKSEDKFKSSCGWPSFDQEIKKAPNLLFEALQRSIGTRLNLRAYRPAPTSKP